MKHESQFASELWCLHCEAMNHTKTWPLNGDAIPFYFEESASKYSIEIMCKECGESWFTVWDDYPGPIERLDVEGGTDDQSTELAGDPNFYLVVKLTVQQAISKGVTEFDDLMKHANEGLGVDFDVSELQPLFRRAWIELHRE